MLPNFIPMPTRDSGRSPWSWLIPILVLATLSASPCLSGHARAQEPEVESESRTTPPSEAPSQIILQNCDMSYEQSTTLSATQVGNLERISVKPGDRVGKDQNLGNVQDDDLQAQLELTRVEANSTVQIDLTKKDYERALSVYRDMRTLLEQGATTPDKVEQVYLQYQIKYLEHLKAQQDQKVAQFRVTQMEATLRKLQFIAPHAGIVAEVYKRQGEGVNLNEPVFDIIDPSVVEVRGRMDVSHLNAIRLGQQVLVWPDIRGVEMAIEKISFAGRVSQISQQIDPRTQTVEIVALVQNPDGQLYAGMKGRMEITPVTLSQADVPRPASIR